MFFLAMEIDPSIYTLLNTLLRVILIYLIITVPIVLTLILMYSYGRYKKWKDIEAREKEKIKVGQANDIRKNDEEIRWQHDEILRLSQDIDVMARRKKSLQDDLGISDKTDAVDPEEKRDLSSMKVKELQALAKERGIKRYSKLKKTQLIKALNESK